jgi:hypothetical protein
MANIFPRWTNTLPLQMVVALGVMGLGVSAAVTYYFTPKYTRVGYQPDQPVPYDHKLHVGQLGMDCRYCHSFVEKSGHANVPAASTCWNCHQHVKPDSPTLEPIRKAADKNYEGYDGKSVEWIRVHRAPDYVYFDHSAHVNRGVSCVSCHGDISEMRVVHHAEVQSMSWCLDCHKHPEKHLRPLDEVFNLKWQPEDLSRKDFTDYLTDKADAARAAELLPIPKNGNPDELLSQEEIGSALKELWKIHPPSPNNCSGCHR